MRRYGRGSHPALLGILASVLGAGCGQPLEQSAREALTEQVKTAHVTFRYSLGDGVDAERQERFHLWISEQLGVTLPGALQYFKYRDREQLEQVTGRRTNGFATPESYAVHSIFPADGHEAVHVYSALVGRPSNFFNEGVAVALNVDPDPTELTPQWNGMHVHAHVKLLRSTKQFVPLEEIVTTDGFRNVDEWRGYGEAGSFVLFLVERYGIAPLREFLQVSSQEDGVEAIDAHLRATWGVSLGDAEGEWLQTVDGWPG